MGVGLHGMLTNIAGSVRKIMNTLPIFPYLQIFQTFLNIRTVHQPSIWPDLREKVLKSWQTAVITVFSFIIVFRGKLCIEMLSVLDACFMRRHIFLEKNNNNKMNYSFIQLPSWLIRPRVECTRWYSRKDSQWIMNRRLWIDISLKYFVQ